MLLLQLGNAVDLTVQVSERIARGVDFRDLADGAVPDPLAEPTNVVGGVSLIAELRDDLVLAGRLHHLPHFVDRVGQRFFTVHVLAAANGIHHRHGVRVVRRTDDDRVDLAVQLVEHRAKVAIPLGLGKLLERFCRTLVIDVGQSNDVFALHSVDARRPATSHADPGDIDLVAGCRLSGTAEHVGRNEVRCCDTGRRMADKRTSSYLVVWLDHGGSSVGHSVERQRLPGHFRAFDVKFEDGFAASLEELDAESMVPADSSVGPLNSSRL